jgi:prepilin-type N-terminal cleavage/methylation domain-containing protein
MDGNKKQKLNNRGFSLLEIVVSLAIFLTVIVIVTSFFEMSIRAQREAISAGNLQESMRYAFEAMSKEIRMAKKDESGACAVADKVYKVENSVLSFINQDDKCVQYFLDSSRIKIIRDTIEAYVTPENIKVNNLSFYLDESLQPRVTLMVNLAIPVKNQSDQEMVMQTTLTSRYY